MADRDAEAVRAHVLSAEVPDTQAQVRLRPAVTRDLELQNGAEQKARWTQGSSQPRPQGEDGRPSLQGGLHHLAGVQRGHSKHPQVSGTPLSITCKDLSPKTQMVATSFPMFNSDEDKSHQTFALKLNLSWQALRARRARSWARPRGLGPRGYQAHHVPGLSSSIRGLHARPPNTGNIKSNDFDCFYHPICFFIFLSMQCPFVHTI